MLFLRKTLFVGKTLLVLDTNIMWGGRPRPQPGPLAGHAARPGGRARVRGPAPHYGDYETALALTLALYHFFHFALQ
jgi:hypothetical protein